MKTTFIFISFLLIILFLRFYFYYTNLEKVEVGDKVLLEHTFLREPSLSDFNQSFRVGEVTVYTQLYPKYSYGDIVFIKGEVEEQEITTEEQDNLIRLVLRDPEIEYASNKPFWLSFTSLIRIRIVEVFERYLPPDQSGLLLGIVFGVREGISEELSEVFRNTGILHVVAASGANVALVGGFLMLIFGKFVNRYLQFVLVSLGIAFYALLSGGEISILRASLMAIFAYGAAIIGKEYSGYIGLFAACFVLLLIDPSIWQDVGFLLSVSSTFGILLLQLPIQKLLHFGRSVAVVEDFSTSFAATIGTVPILFYFFSSYPVLSLLVNVLVLWTVPYLMILGGLAAIFGLISGLFAAPFLYLSMPLLAYFLWIVKIFPQDITLSIENFSIWFVLGYYCLLLAVIMTRSKNAEIMSKER